MTSVLPRVANQRNRKKKKRKKKKLLSDGVEFVKVNFYHIPELAVVHGRFPQYGRAAAQRPAHRNKASSRRAGPGAVMTDEPLNVIRPSTAGYTRFMSETYLEKTEMSMSPERGGERG